MSPGGEVLVRLEEVKVYFYVRRGLFSSVAVRALEEISLDLERGETTGVVGESGSGKTTLGRASLRLARPTAGRILYKGDDITHAGERDLKAFRRRAQAIFQDPYASLSPYMRVYELVEEPLLIHGPRDRHDRQERVLRALDQVKLRPAEEFAGKYPHTLSGGQRQRVNIARAMVLEPEYIVADEPVSMIDASSRAEILYLLRELQEAKGLAFLYITHDLASARHFAKRIAVMYLGRLVELTSAAELVTNPLHPYTQGLLAAVPEPDPANRTRLREVVAGEPPSALEAPAGCPFHPRCPQAIKGTCDAIHPPLIEVEPGHRVACHLYPEPPGAGTSRSS